MVSFCTSGKDKKEYNDIKVIFGDVTKPTQGSI